MAKRTIKAGATDQTVDVFIQDTTSSTGAGLTGLVFNSASLVCYYRKGATGSATQLTLATQTVGGAHSDGGFVEIDATNMPGIYRLDLSDTMVAAAPWVTVMLNGATNMAPVTMEIEITTHADLADAILDRDMATGTDSGSSSVRTVRQALRALRNKGAVVGSTYTVYKEDDSTASWSATVTGTAGADPITEIDPAGP